jgi:hypothetical protein
MKWRRRLGRNVRPDGPEATVKTLDLRFLHRATASLLGYFVHTWFGKYLDVIFANLGRYFDRRMLIGIAEPTATGRYTMLFDFGAIHLENLVYVNGIYFYVLSAHKCANHQLMNRSDRKHVLYLRGYDYEGSVSAGDGLAVGFSSMHTMSFTTTLGRLLAPDEHDDVRIFKVLSPKDVYWETVDAQRYFYTDYSKMIPLSRYPMLSIYLNAATWQHGVRMLLDRMDHYIVYVSSITESVLWELDQLDRDDRRERVTVVFDEAAIENKESQLSLQEGMRRQYGDLMIWAKEGSPPGQRADELRAHLASKFLVTTPEEFERDIERHRQRIAQSSAHLRPGDRETWLDFEFRPALDEPGLQQIRQFSDETRAHIDEWTGERGIDCLPAFLNLVQLRIFCTLLMGEHHETGRALAGYAAVMKAAHDYYSAPDVRVGALSRKRRAEHLKMLTDHHNQAEGIGWSMLSYGRSHEFDDFRARASADYDAAFARTRSAVDRFFATAVQLAGR